MFKNEAIIYILTKIAEHEEVFIVRGRDSLAPETVSHWARLAEQQGVNRQKVDEAVDCAARLLHYPIHRLPD